MALREADESLRKKRRQDAARRYRARNRDKVAAYAKAHRAANLDKEKARQKAWHKANRESQLARMRAWREANRESEAAKDKAWAQANPGKRSAYNALYRAAKLQATPPWVDLAKIERVYTLAAMLSMDVDHIHPLQGENFCGLHVPWNLQILTRSQNSRKSNKLLPEYAS